MALRVGQQSQAAMARGMGLHLPKDRAIARSHVAAMVSSKGQPPLDNFY